MAEQIDLSTPYQPDPRTASAFRVTRLVLDDVDARIEIDLFDFGAGVPLSFTYEGETATQLMRALNKANNSLKSMHRRILERLVADGRLAGTISGSPE